MDDLEAALIENRRRRFADMAATPMPEGQMVGRVMRKPGALDYMAAALRQYGGRKGEQMAEQELRGLQDSRRAAETQDLQRFSEILRGTPITPQTQGNNPSAFTPEMPGVAPDPMAAYSVLAQSRSPALRQAGMQGVLQGTAEQAKRAQEAAQRAEYIKVLQSGVTPQQAIAAGVPVDVVKSYIEAPNIGRPKVKQTIDIEEGGKPVTRMIDEYGQPVGGTMPKYVAPVQVDTSAGIQFVRPEAGLQFSKSMSPAERAADQRGREANRIANENLGLARQRFDFEKTKPDDKPLTDAQAKAALFGVRMQESDRVLSDLAQQGVTRPGLVKRVAETTAGLVPFAGDKIAPIAGAGANWTQSANQQMVEQAQRDFINAVLRRESGAVISPSEFENAEKQYFPQIGDDEKNLQRKAANRQVAIRGILAEVPQSQRARIVGEISGRQAPAATDDPLGLR